MGVLRGRKITQTRNHNFPHKGNQVHDIPGQDRICHSNSVECKSPFSIWKCPHLAYIGVTIAARLARTAGQATFIMRMTGSILEADGIESRTYMFIDLVRTSHHPLSQSPLFLHGQLGVRQGLTPRQMPLVCQGSSGEHQD